MIAACHADNVLYGDPGAMMKYSMDQNPDKQKYNSYIGKLGELAVEALLTDAEIFCIMDNTPSNKADNGWDIMVPTRKKVRLGDGRLVDELLIDVKTSGYPHLEERGTRRKHGDMEKKMTKRLCHMIVSVVYDKDLEEVKILGCMGIDRFLKDCFSEEVQIGDRVETKLQVWTESLTGYNELVDLIKRLNGRPREQSRDDQGT